MFSMSLEVKESFTLRNIFWVLHSSSGICFRTKLYYVILKLDKTEIESLIKRKIHEKCSSEHHYSHLRETQTCYWTTVLHIWLALMKTLDSYFPDLLECKWHAGWMRSEDFNLRISFEKALSRIIVFWRHAFQDVQRVGSAVQPRKSLRGRCKPTTMIISGKFGWNCLQR